MKDRVKELRKMKGLNQKEFGAKIGLSQRAVSEIETGMNSLTERNFDAICKAFSVNPEWLRHGVGEIFMEAHESLLQSIIEEFELTDGEVVLLKTFLELPSEYRAGVIKWAESFASAMATQLGVEYPNHEEIPEHPTTAQKREIMERELAKEEAAAKRGIASSASIGSNGLRKKFSDGY